ncbi:hypothetical protein GALMADRAFT_138886 [Galerina marginata CBS 339.88]|uniref:Uncharacterized protein n=1 Tax=Galerina marginata (strain CBS 339.88) TaxID=685588 RepID=A0A067T3T0_GALM3|nr:hypothetical protein GALMADRAFT_138886 [Galerina marginata CBS 339.88]
MDKNYQVIKVAGLLFPTSGEAKREKVATLSSSEAERIPSLRTVLTEMQSIPIYKTRVVLNDIDQQTSSFDVFFRYNRAMEANQALALEDDKIWHGDIFTMKVGARADYIGINCYSDRHLAERATRHAVLCALACIDFARVANCAPVFASNIDII